MHLDISTIRPAVGSCFKMAIMLVLMALIVVIAGQSVAARSPRHTFAIGDKDFLLDGNRFQMRCGEVHFTRVPREYWRHRLKMCKAMGLNAVCVYLFWNYHEPEPGVFNWKGQADAAEFCRMAQQEGMWVVLRPGPYVCSEWDMGGLPWWLLKNDDVKLRSRDPFFMKYATAWLKEVGRVLAPLQVTRGGPILMAQVENEYGSYGNDVEYMGLIRQALLDAGFTVPLFACNPLFSLRNGYRSDVFMVVNFGNNPVDCFKALRELRPSGPLMCGEFYPGFYDTWGSPHHRGDNAQIIRDLDSMLSADASFSIYMAHGGTSFSLWSGAEQLDEKAPFKPDTSSYDFDAPISEAGAVTEKYTLMRELFRKYLLPGESIPDPPPANPVIEVPRFAMDQWAPIFSNLPEPVEDQTPRTMESYDQGYGCILYRTTLPPGPPAKMEAAEVHDFAWVYLDGRPVDIMDRRSERFSISLPAREKFAQLDILVEAVGRVNYGGLAIRDRKGLHAPVRLSDEAGGTTILTGWKVFNLPLDRSMLRRLHYGKAVPGPAFWRGTFSLGKPGDTFLDMRNWGKGVAWVNGHCLGRFWNIGPTQTMYLPGPWLRAGKNEVIVFDLLGPEKPEMAGLNEPILDQLRLNLDFAHK